MNLARHGLRAYLRDRNRPQPDQFRRADRAVAPERKLVDARVLQDRDADRRQEGQAFEHQDRGEHVDLADFLVVVGDDQNGGADQSVGTARPGAFAAFKLTTNSNLLGA